MTRNANEASLYLDIVSSDGADIASETERAGYRSVSKEGKTTMITISRCFISAAVIIALAACSSAGAGDDGNARYTISYHANGADGGAAPSDTSSYAAGSVVTVADNTGALTRAGFPFFVGWNTAADGSGEEYRPGDTLSMPSEDVTLYAFWIGEARFSETTGGNFGFVVDVDGDYMIIGASEESSGSGRAFIYRRTGPHSWDDGVELATPPQITEVDDFFGGSVAISGDYAVVGASGYDADTGVAGDEGGVFVYRRTGLDTWDDIEPLAIAGGTPAGAGFGASVAISGDSVVVGAFSGAAYAFRRTGDNSWSDGVSLVPNGFPDDGFGFSVAISGDYAIVGAPGDGSASESGEAYVFRRTGDNSWTQGEALLVGGSGLAGGDDFGRSVALSGDYALVGAPGANDTDVDSSGTGAAHLFRRQGTNWSYASLLESEEVRDDDLYGSAVAISDDYAIVGAWEEEDFGDPVSPGAAYLFRRTEIGEWVSTAFEPAGTDSDRVDFGWSVAIDASTVVVGDPQYDGSTGVAYAWRYR